MLSAEPYGPLARREVASWRVAVRAEFLLDRGLAEYLVPADDYRRGLLHEHVVWRVPVARKVAILADVMDEHGLTDVFPFVVPVLNQVFKMRNILAHSLEVPAPEGEGVLLLASVRQGTLREHPIPLDSLEWLQRQGEQVCDEIGLITGALADFPAP